MIFRKCQQRKRIEKRGLTKRIRSAIRRNIGGSSEHGDKRAGPIF
jgi:hypothetical protein